MRSSERQVRIGIRKRDKTLPINFEHRTALRPNSVLTRDRRSLPLRSQQESNQHACRNKASPADGPQARATRWCRGPGPEDFESVTELFPPDAGILNDNAGNHIFQVRG